MTAPDPTSDLGPSPNAVDIPPSLPRLLVLPLLLSSYGLAFTVLRTLGDDTWVDGLLSAPYLVVGVGWAVHRFKRRRRPVLRMDRTGVFDSTGRRVHHWAGTAQVWVGPTPGRWIPGRLRFPALVAYTSAGIDFGRRADFGPTPALNLAVATGLGVDELAAVVRRCTDAPVVTEEDVAFSALTARLRS